MADSKVTNLTALATPADEDILYIVDDPSGTKASKKATLANIVGAYAAQQVLLHDETLGAAGSFDVSGISQDYDDLLLLILLRGDVSAGGDVLNIFFNNDTTAANYHSERMLSSNGTGSSAESADTNIASIPAATAPANSFATVRINIANYADTTSLKSMDASAGRLTAAAQVQVTHSICVWEDGGATAINRITIATDNDPTDEFVTGSRLRIIGIKY